MFSIVGKEPCLVDIIKMQWFEVLSVKLSNSAYHGFNTRSWILTLSFFLTFCLINDLGIEIYDYYVEISNIFYVQPYLGKIT